MLWAKPFHKKNVNTLNFFGLVFIYLSLFIFVLYINRYMPSLIFYPIKKILFPPEFLLLLD